MKQLHRTPDFVRGEEIEEWRLLECNPYCSVQGVLKNGITGSVVEVGEHDSILGGERPWVADPMPGPTPRDTYKQQHNCGQPLPEVAKWATFVALTCVALECFQIRSQVSRRLVSLGTVLFQSLSDHRAQPEWN
jgi:hypothetical protein